MNEQEPYFLLARAGLPRGAGIETGNWGRRVLATPGHGWRTVEVIYEAVRGVVAPQAPSRLNCVFVHPDIETASSEQRRARRHEAIYEVVPAVPRPPVHRTNMAFIHPDVGVDLERFDLSLWSRRYWEPVPVSGDAAQIPEVLLGSPVVVVRQVADALAPWPFGEG